MIQNQMQDFLENINPNVRNINAYTVEGGQLAEIKLNQNESPYDLPSWLKLEILNEFYKENWNRYPEVFPHQAIKRYAKFLGLNPENILMGNGSNELIYTIFLATLHSTSSVLIPSPSFSLYEKVADLLGAQILKVAMTQELEFRVDEIIEEAHRARPNLIVLSTSNNPTGKSISIDDIEKIVSEVKSIVLVDEAYHEFSKQKSAMSLISKYSNVVVLRTMSKAFSMAGLRIGFAISNSSLMCELLKPKIPFATNRLAEIATIKILDNDHLIKESVQKILSDKDRLYQELKIINGIRVHESDANFFIIEVENPKEKFEVLKSKGVLVRNVSNYPMMEKCLRVNVGTSEENKTFLKELKLIFTNL